MHITKIFDETSSRTWFAFTLVIQGFLVISLFGEYYAERWSIFFVNLLALCLTFLPLVLKRISPLKIPSVYQLLFFVYIVVSVFFEKIVTGILLQIYLGLTMGLVGFVLMFILYSNSRIKMSYGLIALFSFCFSVSLGAVWEVFRYVVALVFQMGLGDFSINYTAWGLIFTMCGALLASTYGYFYIKYRGGTLLHRFAQSLAKTNPRLFSDYTKTPDFIK